MKKRRIMALFTAGLVLALCGCGSEDVKTYTADEIIQSAYHINIDDYVKLSDYKSIELTTEKPGEITDDTVTAYIDHVLEQNFSEYKVVEKGSGKVEEDQYVNADLDVSIDGKSVDTEQNIYMHVADDATYGIETSLVGHKKGETVNVKKNITEDDKLFSEYAGNKANFEVKIKDIYTKTAPSADDLTDTFVSENFDCDTVAAYKEQCLETLQRNASYAYSTNLEKEIIEKLKENSEIEYPDNYMAVELDFYTQIAESSAEEVGKELNDYLTSDAGYSSSDDFESQAREEISKSEDQALLMMALAKDMDISITEDDFNSFVDYYIQANSYESEEAFYKSYGSKERIMAIFLEDQAMNQLKRTLIAS